MNTINVKVAPCAECKEAIFLAKLPSGSTRAFNAEPVADGEYFIAATNVKGGGWSDEICMAKVADDYPLSPDEPRYRRHADSILFGRIKSRNVPHDGRE